MPRKRVAPFNPPTPAEAQASPDRVLRGPKGFMWRCIHCGRPASSLTVGGDKICHTHGGSTAAQRNAEKRAAAQAGGQPRPMPPGRPLVTGAYSQRHGVRLNDIVADYRARQIDPDNTDDDMLYLRAHIELTMDRVQDISALDTPLVDVLEKLAQFRRLIVPDEAVSVDAVVTMLDRSRDLDQVTGSLEKLLAQSRKWNSDLATAHARVITMGKIRAETRLKNSAAQQLDVFTLMVRRFMIVLTEQLSPADYDALQKRIEHDLAEIPADVLNGGARVKP